MMMQQSRFSASLVLLLTFFFTTTNTTAQLSPVQGPAASAPTTPTLPQSPTAPPPGFNAVPLAPTSPNAAPTPSMPKAPTIDIVQILIKAKRFSVLIRLLKTTQLINQLNCQLVTSGSSGLTLFTPQDSAFSKLKPRFLNSLSDRQKVELLQFHTLSSFISISNFDTLTNPVQTQAGEDPTRLQLNVTTYGGSKVSMASGAVNATVTGTVYADNKLATYEVDKVLLPLDVVIPKPKASAPSPSKGGSAESDKKKKSSAEESGDDSKNSSDDDGAVSVEASAGSVSFSVEVMCMSMPFVVGLAYVGGAMNLI